MTKALCSLITVVIISIGIYGQDSISFEDKMKMNVDTKTHSWVFKNVFIDTKYSALSELFVIPKKEYMFLEYSYSGDLTPDTIYETDKGTLFTIAGITVEPRINIVDNKSSAWFIKSPISFNFSVTSAGDYPNKNSGFFHFTAPVLLGYSSGLNSTYSNTDRKGIAISAGVQYMRAPITGATTNIDEIYDWEGPEEYKTRRNWIMPLIQFDYYTLSKKGKIKGFSMSMNAYKSFYIKLTLMLSAAKK